MVIAALVTGASCDDPTGDHPEDNFSKRSFSESGQAQGSHRPTATPEVLGTQMPQLACNDQRRVFYLSEAIMIAEVVTGASCNDPNGDCPKVNSSKKSSSES